MPLTQATWLSGAAGLLGSLRSLKEATLIEHCGLPIPNSPLCFFSLLAAARCSRSRRPALGSMSGGHVLVLQSMLASERAADRLLPALEPVIIKAVVAQTPHLDGRENRKKNMMPPSKGGRGIGGALSIARAALQDMVRSALQSTFAAGWLKAAAYIPIVGKVGEVALMPLPADELAYYFRKHPKSAEQKGGGWLNMAPARIALKVGSYNPIDYVPGVSVPVLLVAGARDSLCPAATVLKAAKLCSGGVAQCDLVTLDAGHFEMCVYAGFMPPVPVTCCVQPSKTSSTSLYYLRYYDDSFEQATSAMLGHFVENVK